MGIQRGANLGDSRGRGLYVFKPEIDLLHFLFLTLKIE